MKFLCLLLCAAAAAGSSYVAGRGYFVGFALRSSLDPVALFGLIAPAQLPGERAEFATVGGVSLSLFVGWRVLVPCTVYL